MTIHVNPRKSFFESIFFCEGIKAKGNVVGGMRSNANTALTRASLSIPCQFLNLTQQWFCLRQKVKAKFWLPSEVSVDYWVLFSLPTLLPSSQSSIRALFSAKSNKIRASHFSPGSGFTLLLETIHFTFWRFYYENKRET